MWPELYRSVRRLGFRDADAADAVNSTLRRLFQIGTRFDWTRGRALLFTMAKNFAVDIARAREQQLRGACSLECGNGESSSDLTAAKSRSAYVDESRHEHTLDELRAAVERLPPVLRQYVELKTMPGEPPLADSEIALLLEVSTGKLSSIRRRAFEELRRLLDYRTMDPQARRAHGDEDGVIVDDVGSEADQ